MSILSELKERNREIEATDPGFYDDQMDQTIADLNQVGISLMDYPPSTRNRAFLLEQELTVAANEDRREDFLRLLEEWRNCFH